MSAQDGPNYYGDGLLGHSGLPKRTFASPYYQADWNEDEAAYRAGEQAGLLGAAAECPESLAANESYWRSGFAIGQQMRNQMQFPPTPPV